MVWVSALTGNPNASSGRIFEAFTTGAITVVTSGPLVDEIADTLVEYMRVPPPSIRHQVMGCSDPGDDPVLETATAGGADFVVTRDRRLLELPPHVARYLERAAVAVVRPEQFVRLVAST